jgi:putative tricarboxylic transport membrane protein
LDAGKVDFSMSARPQREVQAVSAPAGRQPDRPLSRARLFASAPYIITLVVAILLFMKVNQLEFDRVAGRIGPDAWPKLILLLMIAAAAWGTAKTLLFDTGSRSDEILHQIKNASQHDAALIDEREIYPARVWAALAGTLAYLWILHYLGFFLSSFAFLAFIIYVGGYRKYSWLLLISSVGSLFFMTIFVRVVYVSLPLGVQPFSAISLALLALLNI